MFPDEAFGCLVCDSPVAVLRDEAPFTSRFSIPGKPVPWERNGIRRGGTTVRQYTPEDTRRYQEAVRSAADRAGCPVFMPGCFLELYMFFPDNGVRDDDNVEKSIRDALQSNPGQGRPPIAWVNDHHVKAVLKLVRVDPEAPRVDVRIRGCPFPAAELKELLAKQAVARLKRRRARPPALKFAKFRGAR